MNEVRTYTWTGEELTKLILNQIETDYDADKAKVSEAVLVRKGDSQALDFIFTMTVEVPKDAAT